MNVNKLKLDEPDYPQILTNLSSPPKELFYLGEKPETWLAKPKVAIVGSRRVTPYGRTITNRIAGELARQGVVIISGLAYGVDIAAHQAALGANGLTVAVLGTSLDNIYPAAHANIAERIMLRGTVISEYPPSTPGFQSNFIARNRIVSGLCDVLLITEAAVNSGSLHTARFALEQGKTVMAVPGNITSPMSEGANNLIKSGAVPVTSADDVLFALKLTPASTRKTSFKGSEAERRILECISLGVTDQEELSAGAGLSGAQLASALTMLEIEGHIRAAGAGNWVLA